MTDLFGDLEAPESRLARQTEAAQAALARACAWAHALSYPRRDKGPTEQWIARYAATQGRHDGARLHAALHRLSQPEREAIAADLLTPRSAP